jgi:hypothetical protein
VFSSNGAENRIRSEEFGEHLQAPAERQSEPGLGRGEALLAAGREFGPVEQAKQRYRDQVFETLKTLGGI